jgi:hypothetical protein
MEQGRAAPGRRTVGGKYAKDAQKSSKHVNRTPTDSTNG